MSAAPQPKETATPAENQEQENPPAYREGPVSGHAELKALGQELERQADQAVAGFRQETKSWWKRGWARIFGSRKPDAAEPEALKKLDEAPVAARKTFRQKVLSIVGEVQGRKEDAARAKVAGMAMETVEAKAAEAKAELLKTVPPIPSETVGVDTAYAKEAGLEAGKDFSDDEKLIDLDELIGGFNPSQPAAEALKEARAPKPAATVSDDDFEIVVAEPEDAAQAVTLPKKGSPAPHTTPPEPPPQPVKPDMVVETKPAEDRQAAFARKDAAHDELLAKEAELEGMVDLALKMYRGEIDLKDLTVEQRRWVGDPDKVHAGRKELAKLRAAREEAFKELQADSVYIMKGMPARVDAAIAKEDAEEAAQAATEEKPAPPPNVEPKAPKRVPGSRPPGVPDERIPPAPSKKPEVTPPAAPETPAEPEPVIEMPAPQEPPAAAEAVGEAATEAVTEAAAAEVEKTPEKAMASATGSFRARFMRDIPNLTLGGYREDLAFELPRLTGLSTSGKHDLDRMKAMDPEAFLEVRHAKGTISPEDHAIISKDPKLVAEYHAMAVKMATERLAMIDKFLAGVPDADMGRASEADEMVDDLLESGEVRDPKKAFNEAWKRLKAREPAPDVPAAEAPKAAPRPRADKKPTPPKAEAPAEPPEQPAAPAGPASWKSLEAAGKKNPFAPDALAAIMDALNGSERSYKTVGTFVEGLEAAGYGFPNELAATEVNKRVKELYKAYKAKKGRA